MSFAQFDDICEICYGMMEEEETVVEEKRTEPEKLDRKVGLSNGKKRREMTAREIVKEKERQLIYK
ncbi:hypothetical protein [Bacillus benzoevorans]|uniref:Uncharacterized protein n=1 Tax=Bacillus benzoevorans TaxID=1456 RepID=A0A7X0HNE5_9BACI|nr:hypothetical protein [Bacillus benzoevorans]MBB6443993.1 hypothetical protein [Bacillus benzoevorans]